MTFKELEKIFEPPAPPPAPAILLKSNEFRRAREANWRELERLIDTVEKRGMRNLNPSGIIPLGPELDFSAPHDRGRLAKAA